MGGGAAMRAAAKVAGITVFNGGLRPGAAATSETFTAARNSVRASAVVSSASAETLRFDVVDQLHHAVQKPVWEIDGWDFADDVDCNVSNNGNNSKDEGFVVDRVDPVEKNRLVFGPVPSLEEATEATSELKDALDKVYLSSPKTPESMETKACITQDLTVPKRAMHAFQILKESPAAQNVVASIACDPNVWNAVMQNPTLVEYLESEKKCATFDGLDSPMSHTGSSHFEEPGKADGLMAIFEDVKRSVLDMVNNLSNFVQSLFAEPDMGKKAESSEGIGPSVFAGGSFMALAMMVIMVVAMKRA